MPCTTASSQSSNGRPPPARPRIAPQPTLPPTAAPAPLHRYIAAKGSITVDGVSLTVNAVEGQVFGLNIIPHTWQATTLGGLKAGDAVNLEIDMLARYLARWQETA